MEHKYLFVAVDAALKAGEEILSIYTESGFGLRNRAESGSLSFDYC